MREVLSYEQTRRIWKLLTLLQAPGFTLRDLAAGCKASVHTTAKDLRFLRSMGLKIQKDQANAHVQATYHVPKGTPCPSCCGIARG